MTLVCLPASLKDRFERGLALRQQEVRGRFAPSPSGVLHLGNLRTALLSWLQTRCCDGLWLVRIDDLDRPRVRRGAEESILADLHWLGLHWDGPLIRQSERRGLYASALSALRRADVLYPCHCSRRLLADISAPHGRLAVYPGHCRLQTPFWGENQGRWPSWRLKLEEGLIGWQECWGPAGELHGLKEVGDVVLRRADGVVAYHLATAVDELTLGITDVVRGADLWWSTGAQVAVSQALGFPPPRYGHVPVLCDQLGHRLSKRLAAEGLETLRAQGMDPPSVIGTLAASVGLVADGTRLSAEELLAEVRGTSTLEEAMGKSSQSFRIPPPCERGQARQSV